MSLRWRPSALAREAVIGTLAARATSAIRFVALAAAVFLQSSLLIAEAETARDITRLQRETGSRILIAKSGGQLTGSACQSLSRSTGVARSGATAPPESILVLPTTALRFNAVALQADVLDMLAPNGLWTPTASVLLGAQAASELGVGPGLLIGDTPDLSLNRVGGVVDVSQRREALNRSVFLVRAELAEVEECWVELAGDVGAAEIAAVRGMLDLSSEGASERVEVRRLSAIDELDASASVAFGERSTRYSWLWSAIAVGVLLGIVRAARPTHMALMRAWGTTRIELLVLWTIDYWLLAVPAASVGLLASWMLSEGSLTTELIFLDGAYTVGLLGGGFLVSVVLSLVLSMRSVESSLRAG